MAPESWSLPVYSYQRLFGGITSEHTANIKYITPRYCADLQYNIEFIAAFMKCKEESPQNEIQEKQLSFSIQYLF